MSESKVINLNNKKKGKYIVIAVVVVLLLIIGMNSFFVLNENESAVVKRFGSIQACYVKSYDQSMSDTLAEVDPELANVQYYEGSGLKFKIPFIDTVTKYTNLLITYNTATRQVITMDKKKLYFDNNAQWMIENPVLFDITMGSISSAQLRIDDILYATMNEHVGRIESTTLITDKEYNLVLLSELTEQTSKQMQSSGVEIYDIRIRRTDVPEENHESIYNRMITERQRIAAQYRSEGAEEALKITSNTDKSVTVLLSEANAQSEQERGRGDAEAAKIYNEAYGSDPDFFEFYNMLETYKTTLGDKATLVIPTDSTFAKFLLGSGLNVNETAVTAAGPVAEMPEITDVKSEIEAEIATDTANDTLTETDTTADTTTDTTTDTTGE